MDIEKSGNLLNIAMIVVFMSVMYFFMVRPTSKKRKQEQAMRDNIQVGDEIVTIGGIVGRVVSLKDDAQTLIIETGADRSKIKVKKWAIASCAGGERSEGQA